MKSILSRTQLVALLAFVVLFSALVVAAAQGEALESGQDPAESSFLPSGVTSAAALAPLVADVEPVEPESAADPLAAEELPHTDLGRPEAEELLVGVFGGELESSAKLLEELDVEAFRSDHVAVVAPAEPDADPGLLSSLLPLRAETEQGDKELVDLTLESEGDHLEPTNPLVPIEIPSELSDGIALPGTGIVIDIASGVLERRASEVGSATAFFPNIRPDSDLVVSAIPTGVETFTQLRSPEAPTAESFDLTMPQGAELKEIASGAQVVDSMGKVILSISAPSAFDAQGEKIPVNIQVAGANRVVISVDPPEDASYPLLVDPVFENYNFNLQATPGALGKDWSGAANQGFGYGWGSFPNYGMTVQAFGGAATSPGNQAAFNYYVPRYWSDIQGGLPMPTSYIREMKLWNLTFLMPKESAPYPAYPFMQMGLWSETMQQFVAYGKRYGSEGPLTDGSYVYDLVNPNDNTDVKRGGFAIATFNSWNQAWRYVNAQQAWVEVTDKDSPTFGELGSVPEWVSTKEGTPLNYKATDPGIGIHSMRLEYTKATGIKGTPITGLGCTGNAGNPCPRTVSKATKQIPYYPDLMPQGENWINIYAVDAVNHWSEAGATRIKVDRSKPELSTSGTLTEQAKVGVNLSEYSLELATVDGDEATATATTPLGSPGTGPGQLERPQGLAVDSSGNSWITDRTNQKVVEYDSAGKLIREINVKGSGDGQINEPRGAAIAATGNVWVAEAGNKRIQQFSPTGGFVSKIVNAAFVEPWGVAVAPDGTLWVTDPGAKKVFLFKEDGTLIRTISSTGSGPLGAGVPFGIDVDEFNNAWVALQGTDQIMALNPAGESIAAFGGTGTEAGKFKAPMDIAISPSGNIFVSDDGNSRIQEFRRGGLFMRQFGTAGSASNQLKEPRAIDVTSLGNELLVVDAGNRRVARWTHADRHPESGTVKTEIKVDGVLKDITNPGCAEKNCKISRKWTLKADEYSVGAHTVEAIATDGVGLQTKKTIQIETHGDLQAPQLALSGTMTEQATLGNTRPTYKIKAAATDPGLSTERKSGVASTSIKVDGVTVDSTSPGCATGGCSITREWTLSSSSYAAGTHLVEVKATDAAGRTTAKTLSIKIERDVTPPVMTLSGGIPSAPEGWVQQETKNATVVATDDNGYGVKQVKFLIDGKIVGQTAAQTCPTGACTAFETFAVNLAAYDGGAHEAVMTAEDLAGNVRKKTWALNVDPAGNISASEAEDTLEALDATSPVNTVGASQEEEGYEGTVPGLQIEQSGEVLLTTGGANAAEIATAPGAAATVAVAAPNAFEGDCEAVEPVEPEEGEATKEFVEPADGSDLCDPAEEAVIFSDPLLTSVEVEPTNISPSASATELSQGEVAGITSNVAPHVDLVTRPLFDGLMTFTTIRDSAATETFMWEVRLAVDQELKQTDATHVSVFYKNGPRAFMISATPAHDAVGSAVPSTVAVSGPNTVTLTVAHKGLGPDGKSFVYPVSAGAGWEGGFQTYSIVMPPSSPEEPTEEEGYSSVDRAIVLIAQGPPIPEPSNPDTALLKSSVNSVKKKFKFVYCKPHEYPGGQGIAPYWPHLVGLSNTPGKNIPMVVSDCSNPDLEGIYWKVSSHGWFHFIRDEWAWIKPKEWDCEKGGEEQDQFAKVGCAAHFGGGDLRKAGNGLASRLPIKVMGNFRFPPGNGNWELPVSALCFTEGGVLDSTPNRILDQPTQRPMIWEKDAVHWTEHCDWPDY